MPIWLKFALALSLVPLLLTFVNNSWRNERERPADRRLPALIEAFDLKVDAGLRMLEAEVPEFTAAPFSVGHIALGCALGYIDLRFESLAWRDQLPALAAWQAEFKRRPSTIATEAVDDR